MGAGACDDEGWKRGTVWLEVGSSTLMLDNAYSAIQAALGTNVGRRCAKVGYYTNAFTWIMLRLRMPELGFAHCKHRFGASYFSTLWRRSVKICAWGAHKAHRVPSLCQHRLFGILWSQRIFGAPPSAVNATHRLFLCCIRRRRVS